MALPKYPRNDLDHRATEPLTRAQNDAPSTEQHLKMIYKNQTSSNGWIGRDINTNIHTINTDNTVRSKRISNDSMESPPPSATGSIMVLLDGYASNSQTETINESKLPEITCNTPVQSLSNSPRNSIDSMVTSSSGNTMTAFLAFLQKGPERVSRPFETSDLNDRLKKVLKRTSFDSDGQWLHDENEVVSQTESSPIADASKSVVNAALSALDKAEAARIRDLPAEPVHLNGVRGSSRTPTNSYIPIPSQRPVETLPQRSRSPPKSLIMDSLTDHLQASSRHTPVAGGKESLQVSPKEEECRISPSSPTPTSTGSFFSGPPPTSGFIPIRGVPNRSGSSHQIAHHTTESPQIPESVVGNVPPPRLSSPRTNERSVGGPDPIGRVRSPEGIGSRPLPETGGFATDHSSFAKLDSPPPRPVLLNPQIQRVLNTSYPGFVQEDPRLRTTALAIPRPGTPEPVYPSEGPSSLSLQIDMRQKNTTFSNPPSPPLAVPQIFSQPPSPKFISQSPPMASPVPSELMHTEHTHLSPPLSFSSPPPSVDIHVKTTTRPPVPPSIQAHPPRQIVHAPRMSQPLPKLYPGQPISPGFLSPETAVDTSENRLSTVDKVPPHWPKNGSLDGYTSVRGSSHESEDDGDLGAGLRDGDLERGRKEGGKRYKHSDRGRSRDRRESKGSRGSRGSRKGDKVSRSGSTSTQGPGTEQSSSRSRSRGHGKKHRSKTPAKSALKKGKRSSRRSYPRLSLQTRVLLAAFFVNLLLLNAFIVAFLVVNRRLFFGSGQFLSISS